jgi:tRNA U55 pseudouridine synthase TruB
MNGIIVVNKEKDYTSRDIVNIVGKQFHTKKIHQLC